MKYTVLYFDEINKDLLDAKLWYKTQKEGLELSFSFEIEKAINHIIKMPYSYSIKYSKIKIAYLRIFPYNIHFYVDKIQNLLVVTAIVHNKRHTNFAEKRVLKQ